jgi:hypothetical protein
MDLAMWQRRVVRIARSEAAFVRMHTEVAPYFHDLFSDAARHHPARGRAARLARWIPPGTPVLGRRVWDVADIYWRQQLAPAFFAAWNEATRT